MEIKRARKVYDCAQCKGTIAVGAEYMVDSHARRVTRLHQGVCTDLYYHVGEQRRLPMEAQHGEINH